MANKWNNLKRKMSPQAQARVDARVKATLQTMPLAEIRKAIGMTQADLAGKLDVAQGSVSKIENAADMYLTTLRKYVEALGGELRPIRRRCGMNEVSWNGVDLFNRPIMAVRGNNGSIILHGMRDDDDDSDDKDGRVNVISMNATIAAAFAEWVKGWEDAASDHAEAEIKRQEDGE